jgi:hypothetical protein
MKIKAVSPEEQVFFFRTLIRSVPKKNIRNELNNLVTEFKSLKIDGQWDQTLPKLENLVDLAQELDDHTFLMDVFLLAILIRNSIR